MAPMTILTTRCLRTAAAATATKFGLVLSRGMEAHRISLKGYEVYIRSS